MSASRTLEVRDSSQIGEARRISTTLARELSLGEEEINRVALVVTELATNLVKHTGGRGGEILLQRAAGDAGTNTLELISLDQGMGMANLALAMRDGYSTSGTSGSGLGGIRRLSTRFDAYSRAGQGTAIFAQIGAAPPAPAVNAGFSVGGVCLPLRGEDVSGDLWDIREGPDAFTLVVSDGLGHGPLANEASREALRIVGERSDASPENLFGALHSSLRKTRGAAISATTVSLTDRTARFMGIGNVAGAIVIPGKIAHMVSLNGIVGHEVRKLQEFRYPFPKGAVLVMYSDGLGSKWDIEKYPGLINRHPTLIAGLLYRDFARGRDDVTVVVVKEREP